MAWVTWLLENVEALPSYYALASDMNRNYEKLVKDQAINEDVY